MADNTVTIVGNVTRDPELKFLNGGNACTKFSLAHNSRWKDRQGEWQEKVGFYEVVCYGTLANNIANSIAKGMRVVVNGKLEQRAWETPDGAKRSVVEINADEVAPSLKWATAVVTKTPRDQGQGGAPQGGGAAPHQYDEEPF